MEWLYGAAHIPAWSSQVRRHDGDRNRSALARHSRARRDHTFSAAFNFRLQHRIWNMAGHEPREEVKLSSGGETRRQQEQRAF